MTRRLLPPRCSVCSDTQPGERCGRCATSRTERRLAYAIDLAAYGRHRLAVIAALAACAAYTPQGRVIRLTPASSATFASLLVVDLDTTAHTLHALTTDGTLTAHHQDPERFTVTVAAADEATASTIAARVNRNAAAYTQAAQLVWNSRGKNTPTPSRATA